MDPFPPDRFRPSREKDAQGGRWRSEGDGDGNPLLIKLRRANAFSEAGVGGREKKKQLDKCRRGRAGAAGAERAARALCVVRYGRRRWWGRALFPKKG